MKHTASKIRVYESSDYKIFKTIDGNRAINKKKIAKIINEINSGNDVLAECPVLVKENGNGLEIVDGQHRLLIAQQLKRPVHYILKETKTSLYNIAKINSNTEKWKADDFIHCYVTAGNDNYKKLSSFNKKYGISIGCCLALLTHGILTHDGTIATLYLDFEHGKYEVKKLKEATQFAEICKSFSVHPGWNRRSFMIAIAKILRAEKCEMDVLLKKFNNDPKQLTYHSDWKGYINNLEIIYNIGNSKRRVIF